MELVPKSERKLLPDVIVTVDGLPEALPRTSRGPRTP